jgi:hypothetical protein
MELQIMKVRLLPRDKELSSRVPSLDAEKKGPPLTDFSLAATNRRQPVLPARPARHRGGYVGTSLSKSIRQHL